MAAVIHELWMGNDAGLLIMPGSLPLDVPNVRDELTRHLSEGWNSVVDREVDGKRSLPFQQDETNSRYGKVLASRRVSRTIMLGSAPTVHQQNVRSIEASRIRLGVVQPGEHIVVFNDALGSLQNSLAYLYSSPSGDRFWYDTRPTLRKTVEDNPRYQFYEVALYYKNYTAPPLPPSWIVMEHLSMGEWCKALPMLVRIEQKIIGREFGLPANLMTSWISSLALLRNVCAHHGMLWHRRNTRRPELQKNPPRFCPDFSADSGNYYASACIMQYFLKTIAPASSWSSRLKALFDEFSPQFVQDFGFPPHWEQNTFWGIR